MSKRPTPKKQQANSQTSRRYKTFQNNVRKRLVGGASLVECPKCKEQKLAHAVCATCGYYKGRPVVDKMKQVDKITKIKA